MQLVKEKKKKDEALTTTQGYCADVLNTRKKRDDALAKAKKVDELVAAAERQVKDKFEALIVNYNANVLKSQIWRGLAKTISSSRVGM